MTKKQSKTKGAKKSSKATKAADATVAPKAPRERVRDARLPAAGTVMKRTFKGNEIKVTVLEHGFRWEGKEYKSLTALALEITGYPAISGPAFFKLTGTERSEPKAAVAKAPKGKRAAKKTGVDAAPDAGPEVAPVAEAV